MLHQILAVAHLWDAVWEKVNGWSSEAVGYPPQEHRGLPWVGLLKLWVRLVRERPGGWSLGRSQGLVRVSGNT